MESRVNPADLKADLARDEFEDEDDGISLVEIGTWLGEGKKAIGLTALAFGLVAAGATFLMTPIFTAHSTLMAPNKDQGSGGGALAALAAMGGGLGASLGGKTPDELYVALLKGDSVVRELDKRFDLKDRYHVKNFESLRKAVPQRVKIAADKKSGLITVDVDDEDPKFAADLANAHTDEVTKVLGRLAVTEAQQRRAFFEKQMSETKENLSKAELNMKLVQEKSGVIVLDRQAEALIGGAATIRARIAETEVKLRVARTTGTDQNPQVRQLSTELAGLRAELTRMESNQAAASGSSFDMPVGRIPEASLDYIRARRELKLQETLLESMVRQFEIAKLDEAKEGPVLQQVDLALPPDFKSKPARSLIVLGALVGGLLLSSVVVVWRRYSALLQEADPGREVAWKRFTQAWRLRK